ncbi:hypothetical protein WKI71_05735 [Streptomyces sp. MS1.AVA.1]|uniref:Uncharacterized protein n=1 Tax=Streptomyces machairae TaxID=3134109 RepID=A0ABU8UH36_9ACTN
MRVRPRLPGPFERVEAVRATAPEPDDGSDLLWPATTPSAVRPGTGRPRRRPPRGCTRNGSGRSYAPNAPRPTRHRDPPRELCPRRRCCVPSRRSRPAPGPRRTPFSGRRAVGARSGAHPGPRRPCPSPGHGRRIPTAGTGALRPSAADTAAARDAVRQAAARRPSRAPEQVVQVQIGRLEVTAGQSPSQGTRQRTPSSTERPGATLSLADYLARGRE